MPPVELYSEPRNVVGQASTGPTDPVKIHIGCGNHRLPDYVNCDLYKTGATDRVFDCTGPWPFADNAASRIYCSHTLEHLHDFKAFFREAYRVLQPDGFIQIRVPYGGHRAAWWDITHIRPWFAESFCFLQPGYDSAVANAQHRGWRHFFSVEDVMFRVSARIVPLLRWKLVRIVLLPWLDCFDNIIEELWIYLVALKSEDRVLQWSILRDANGVPGRYVAYRHHFEGRAQDPQEAVDFVTLGTGFWPNGFHSWHTGAP